MYTNSKEFAMDLNEELRSKRLNYYNKVLSSSITRLDLGKLGELAQGKPPLRSSIELKKRSSQQKQQQEQNVRNSQTTSMSTSLSTTTLVPTNKSEILNKIFGDAQTTHTSAMRGLVKFNHSLSFDETSTASLAGNEAAAYHQTTAAATTGFLSSSSSSRRLEEFKRMVESSYEEHVLNKPESVFTSNNNTNNNNKVISNSVVNETQQPQQVVVPPLSSTEPGSESLVNSSRQAASTTTTRSGSASSRVKIPYMSAYNIYDFENDFMSSSRGNVNLDITSSAAAAASPHPNLPPPSSKTAAATAAPLKKSQAHTAVGSNGSSLNTSPTSLSSGESAVVDSGLGGGAASNFIKSSDADFVHLPGHQASTSKPSLTPRRPQTGAPTFRTKNLLKRNTSSATATTTIAASAATTTVDKIPLPLDSPLDRSARGEVVAFFDAINYRHKSIDFHMNPRPNVADQQQQPVNDPQVPETVGSRKQERKSNEDELNDNDDDSSHHDSGSDTFDIFSSRESLHNGVDENDENGDNHHGHHGHHHHNPPRDNENKNRGEVAAVVTKTTATTTTTVQERQRPAFKRMDLSIDLSGINSDEDDKNADDRRKKNQQNNNDTTTNQNSKKNQQQDKNHNELLDDNDDDDDVHFIMTTSKRTSASSMRQVKPDNIPNLTLDQFDDDKSQSVTVSLAKSMCKEINYKKEMEAIVSKENLNITTTTTTTNSSGLQIQSIQQTPYPLPLKSNRLKPIADVKKRGHHQPVSTAALSLNLTSGVKQKENSTSSSSKAEKSYFLRPISSSRENSSRGGGGGGRGLVVDESEDETTKYNQTRPMSSTGVALVNKPPVVSLSEPNKSRNQQDSVKSFVKKSKSYLNARKSTAVQSRVENRYWESSYAPKQQHRTTPMMRSSSAKLVVRDLKTRPQSSTSIASAASPTLPPQLPPSPMFLNYSKLIAIESSFDCNNNLLSSESSDDVVAAADDHLNLATNSQVDQHAEADGLELIDLSKKASENNDGMRFEAQWLELPDELWLKILSNLKQSDLANMGRTCRKLNRIYVDSSLWRKITLKYKYEMSDDWLACIGNRRPNELNIIQCSGNLTLFAISEMFRNIGEQLTSLNLSRCSNGALSGDNFALQASIRCPNVTNLDLSWTLLSNQTLKLIVDSFRKIENINLSGCNMIQEDGFNALLLRHGESLKCLEISGCIHFSSNSLINIGVYCRNIERLSISNCHRMTNEALMESCQHWPKLKHIDFRGIKNIKNNCVSLMARKCPGLESIAFGECVNIGDTSILEIATYKPNIKYLDANSCKKLTDNSLRSLASFCSKLQNLNIRSTNVTDIGLLTLANGKCNQSLEEINLSYLPITEKILLKIIRNSKKLKRVLLYGCFNIKNIENIRQSLPDRLNSIEVLI